MSGKRSHISSKSAIEHAKEFPDDFYEDSGYLFCKYCQIYMKTLLLSN